MKLEGLFKKGSEQALLLGFDEVRVIKYEDQLFREGRAISGPAFSVYISIRNHQLAVLSRTEDSEVQSLTE